MFHDYPNLEKLIIEVVADHEDRLDSPDGKLRKRGKREKLYPNTALIWEAMQRKKNASR